MADYGKQYENARNRVLVALQPLEWRGWKVLRRVGGIRYGARLRELRRIGYQIISTADPGGHGKQYKLVSPLPISPQGKRVKTYLEPEDVETLLFEDRLSEAASAALAEALDTYRANIGKL